MVALVEKVVADHARIDSIIHNAGFVRDKTLRKMSDDQWNEVMDVHLTASFKLSRAAWPHFEEQGWAYGLYFFGLRPLR